MNKILAVLALASVCAVAQVRIPAPGGIAPGGGGCSPTSGHSYSTLFPATENPISECSSWLNGALDGTNWTDVATTTNFAFGTELNTSSVLDDSTAVLKGTW